MNRSSSDVTQLLQSHAAGAAGALDGVFAQVYDELRRMARARLRHERADHTLGATELVHEAFFRLVRIDRIDWQSRAHFLAIASHAMRNVLLDYAAQRGAQKRGGGMRAVTLERLEVAAEAPPDDLFELVAALADLEKLEPRQARVVECKFFGGMSIEEIAEALDISPATVSRDWTIARAWLHAHVAEASGKQDGR